ncbi:MAG: ribonucleoside-diphosphate reductase subunit alpha [Candidatus Omnitrophica bacterium]|nr:ribonucleoside-diphosphate reductase subunit alpha [Candidatus Omnitrophota bacterium]
MAHLRQSGPAGVALEYEAYRRAHDAKRFEAERITIQKRDGKVVSFKPEKIAIAVGKAFAAQGPLTHSSRQAILDLSDHVVELLRAAAPDVRTVNIEEIQDLVERILIEKGHHEVARRFIHYREQRRLARLQAPVSEPVTVHERFNLKTSEGKSEQLDLEKLKLSIALACRGLEDRVSVEAVLERSLKNCFEGMTTAQLHESNILAARSLVERDSAYSFVAARLLLQKLYKEALGRAVHFTQIQEAYPALFKQAIELGVKYGRLSSELLKFDLERLGKSLKPERDFQFAYLGLQTLYDRYFIHQDGRRLETPQIFWMRIAMGLAQQEKEREKYAAEFYEVMSNLLYVPSTPTLFNAGTLHPQLSSCFLTTVQDDLDHIFKSIRDNALLSKWSGGLGNDWTPVRALGAHIQGTNGKSQGLVPFLKVANDTAVAVNQCFSPDAAVFTAEGIKPITDVRARDLVLGRSGFYREVTDHLVYRQQGHRMVEIKVKHAIRPLTVSASHPFWVIQGVPMETGISRTVEWLKRGKIKPAWIEAGQLGKGDYVAQVIPAEVVLVKGLSADDARLYGILLGDGHLSKQGREWGVSGNPTCDGHMQFVRDYLGRRDIHFWESHRNSRFDQIKWAGGYGVGRDAGSGRLIRTGTSRMPFCREDIYDSNGHKHIAQRFAHLPPDQTAALIRGLLETDGGISRGKEIYFTNTSAPLVEGLRYQLLRLGVPSAGQYRVRRYAHTGKRIDGQRVHFKGATACYDLRIPAVSEIAELVGCRPMTKHNWLQWKGWLFTRIRSARDAAPVPVVYDLKVEGDESYMTSAALVHNGGKRQGAVCAYLEMWHLDVEEFLELRKNTGDDRRRTHDMHTANWIPDLFMKRVLENGPWTLFSPNEAPDLHDLYGKAFEMRYELYERMAKEGGLKQFKVVPALELWRKALSMLFETGHPWITFKDASNVRSPQDHAGVVHSSNLCTEILLNTSREETAVCNLGSLNLAALTTPSGLHAEKLAATVKTAMRMLDNVIDLNFYPTPEAKAANQRHRPVGLGIMGFQDALYLQGMSYASPRAVEFADASMEVISYHAILSSSRLAQERGAYSTYRGSKWDRGLLPKDTIELLRQNRGGHVEMETGGQLDWTPVRESIRQFGMRNSNTMAIAPTATIANIAGVSQSIEPTYKNLYVKSNLSGEFITVNPYLEEELKALGLWDSKMVDDLKYFDGSLNEIERIPQEVKDRYAAAFEIGTEWIIECASRRQKWIDMGQSLNLYLAQPSGKKMHAMYLMAWEKGLKTTYYLRSLGATRIEKSTVDANRYGDPLGQKDQEKGQKDHQGQKIKSTDAAQCSIVNPDQCEVCQ